MANNRKYSANFGPMLVEVRRNATGAGAGPTVRIYAGHRELVRMDLFPEDPHYHINPYTSDRALDTVRKADGVITPEGLRKHLLEVVGLRGLAVLAGEVDVVDYLDYVGAHAVNAYVNDRVAEISGIK